MRAPVASGDVIAQGRYRIERIVGEGGMGVVALATHVGFDDKVAIKLLRPEVAENPEHVQRFLREGRAARKIRSEHVVHVTDVGTLESGAPYMVMEYLEGEDLAARLARTGPLAYPEALELMLQACEAIAEAHVIGIVHRDLKPSNLFAVERRGGARFLKVLDFGISKITGGAGATSGVLTRTSSTMGSPLYMSPEQLHSARDVDSRADIWALGVIFVELLTGAHPFTAEDLPRLCVQILAHPPSPELARREELPRPLVDAVMRCLEKSPAKRFQTVAELAVALAPVCNERARQSVDRITAIFASSPAPPLSPSSLVPPPSTTPWNPLAHAPTIPSARTPMGATSDADAVTTGGPAVISTVTLDMTMQPTRARRKKLAIGAAALVALASGGLIAARAMRTSDVTPPAITSAGSVAIIAGDTASADAPAPPPPVAPEPTPAPPSSSAPTSAPPPPVKRARPTGAPPIAKPTPSAAPAPTPKPKATVDDTL